MSVMMKKTAALLFTNKGNNIALLILRVFIGVMMLTHGIAKIEHFSTLAATFPDPLGIGSTLSLTLITMVEVGASCLLIAGVLTRLILLPLIFSMCVAAFLTFPEFSLANSELPMIYLSIYVTLFFAGPGKYSVDYVLNKQIQAGGHPKQ